MPDLLLEIGTEEIPAAYLGPALVEMSEKAHLMLEQNRLQHGRIETAATPRRLVLYIENMAEHQSGITRETRGPAARVAFDSDGRPTPAATGFARSQGLEVNDLETRLLNGGEYLFAVVSDAGTTAVEVLENLLPGLISGLYFPKMQRWGDGELRFARPIRWITAMLGESVLNFSLDGVHAGAVSRGHRFLSPETFTLASAESYWQEMAGRYVMVRQEKRKEVIRAGAEHLAAEFQGHPLMDEELLEEVAFLVEYPTPFAGGFEPEYLDLPRQVLSSVMRKHQKFFPVSGGGDNLLPLFIAVRNGLEEGIDIVRDGNSKVLKARLADARFFYDEDRKSSLESRVQSLSRVTFQEKLGSLLEKTERIRRLTGIIAALSELDAAHKVYADRAALLCKADLLTNMVCEFPELQGFMGRDYALLEGEPLEVAVGIYEHYLPRYAGDALPATMVGAAVALADRLDTLAGFFGIGIRPTGSQDPFALRRAGNSVIRILLDLDIRLHLHTLLHEAVSGYAGRNGAAPATFKDDELTIVEELYAFLGDRLTVALGEEGHSYDTISVVMAVPYDDPVDARQRAVVLEDWRKRPDFSALATAVRRVESILKDAVGGEIDPDLFQSAEEEELYAAFNEVRADIDAALLTATADYNLALTLLLRLVGPINAFFDKVMVMAREEKVRDNRISLLDALRRIFRQIGDFSLLAE